MIMELLGFVKSSHECEGHMRTTALYTAVMTRAHFQPPVLLGLKAEHRKVVRKRSLEHDFKKYLEILFSA